MNLWCMAFDDMSELDANIDNMSIGQRLKLAEIKALLSIGQELSKIRNDGTNSEYVGDAS